MEEEMVGLDRGPRCGTGPRLVPGTRSAPVRILRVKATAN